jgi:hypothetical protein
MDSNCSLGIQCNGAVLLYNIFCHAQSTANELPSNLSAEKATEDSSVQLRNCRLLALNQAA